MKQECKRCLKRIAAMSLITLTFFGAGPLQPIADVFDSAIVARADTEASVKVSNYEELKTAIEGSDITSIIITSDIDVPCEAVNRTTKTTVQININRSLTIESEAGSKYIIKRIASSEANRYSITSIFGIEGNGNGEKYNNIATNTVRVSLRNIIIDGGAIWSDDGVTSVSPTNTGVSGRSIIDVYHGATLNLEDGVELRNGNTTNSVDSTYIDTSSSSNYGGAVRIDYTAKNGGGTVNIKTGSEIHDCFASGGWGGAVGGYNYSYINMCGGTIHNCSSSYGGAIGCTYRASTSRKEAGIINMSGGYI